MNWNLYEYEKMKEVRAEHPDWIWNRGDTHVILGVPGCLEAYKTPVELGNSFSPGPGTYGVSTWVFNSGVLYAPEEKKAEEFLWSFENGYLPILHARWMAGDVEVHSELFPMKEGENYRDYFSVKLTNNGSQKKQLKFYLVIRSFGASGGPIRELKGEGNYIWVNGSPMILADEKFEYFGAVSFEHTGNDISQYLKKGELPEISSVTDDSTWASGAASYTVVLQPNETKTFDFGFQKHMNHWLNGWMEPQKLPLKLNEKRNRYLAQWKELLSIELNLPDKRFSEAFQCQLAHLYMFTVDNSIRITPISYPLWWLRDGAYVLNALSRGGFHEFADRACREIASKDAFGGFGSEGDGPSDGIWVLSEHYLLTRDKEFLKEMYPHIKRKAELLMEMRRTEKPMRKFTEFVIPKCMLDPNSDLLCMPAKDGLIMGRMDHGIRPFWINSFAYMAMKRAAFCASELGVDASAYEQEAKEIHMALIRNVEKEFGKDERDVNSAFWPGEWAERSDKIIKERFDSFWEKVRWPNGIHSPEKEWTYFECGQAHNYMLLGEREKAWVTIEWFLSHHTSQGLYTYSEAIDGNTALLWPRTRGWDDVNYVTPHGWTAAELFHLLRDSLIREENGELIIGSGIPKNWEGKSFSVKKIPTYFGKISYTYVPQEKTLYVALDGAQTVEVRQELPFEVKIVKEVVE